MTNGDRIRKMTDEELAEWFAPHFMCTECDNRSMSISCSRDDCKKYALLYLKKEEKENG